MSIWRLLVAQYLVGNRRGILEVQEYHKVYIDFMKNKVFRSKKGCSITLWDLEFIMRDIIFYNNIDQYRLDRGLYRLIEDSFIDKYLEPVSVAPNYWLLKEECIKQGRMAFKLFPNANAWVGCQSNAQCLDLLVKCVVHDFNNSYDLRSLVRNFKVV